MIIDELKRANMEALRNHDSDSKAVLGVLINKYTLLANENKVNKKETTDADVARLITKLNKELDEEIASFKLAGRDEQIKALEKQKSVIAKFLPTLLSEEEIRKEISLLPDKSIPSVMKHFKEKFPGKCDMGLVNKIARGQ